MGYDPRGEKGEKRKREGEGIDGKGKRKGGESSPQSNYEKSTSVAMTVAISQPH